MAALTGLAVLADPCSESTDEALSNAGGSENPLPLLRRTLVDTEFSGDFQGYVSSSNGIMRNPRYSSLVGVNACRAHADVDNGECVFMKSVPDQSIDAEYR